MGTHGERYARGTKAYGMCQKCGLRFLLNELVFDGTYNWMRVCVSCQDPRHPQERMVRIIDPIALWRPAPEAVNTAPILSGVQIGSAINLTWTDGVFFVGRVESYALYRSTDNVTFTLLINQGITYAWDGSITQNALSYSNSGIVSGNTFYYYVVALDIYGNGLRSNTITLVA